MRRRELKRRKRAVNRLAEKFFNEAKESGEIETPAQLSNAIVRSLMAAVSIAMRGIGDRDRQIDKAVRVGLDSGAETFAAVVDDNGEEWVGDLQRFHDGFSERLQERWAEGLYLCDLTRIVCLEVGTEHHKEHWQVGGARHHVLAKLHAKACLIAGEIIALLKGGYASGAHARWRSLHEVAVIGTFIADGDEGLAERYLEYVHVESLAAARDLQENPDALGLEPVSDGELSGMEEVVVELCRKHGSMFKRRNGWAAHHFGHAPDFRTIERAKDLSHYRPYYRMASNPVHAGPKGIAFDMGMLRQGDAMLAGPSNAGLADPGHALCISLTQITAAFLNLEPAAGNVVTIRVLMDLSNRAGDALIRAHRQLEDDDAKINESEYLQGGPMHP